MNIPTCRCFPGRFSRPSALVRRSFLLTAAGQFRIHTGFPCDSEGNVTQSFQNSQPLVSSIEDLPVDLPNSGNVSGQIPPPKGEGGPKGRVRGAKTRLFTPHPPPRGPLPLRERDTGHLLLLCGRREAPPNSGTVFGHIFMDPEHPPRLRLRRSHPSW